MLYLMPPNMYIITIVMIVINIIIKAEYKCQLPVYNTRILSIMHNINANMMYCSIIAIK